ncbi:MAG: ADP-ribosylglycohydrolase family protein [Verrucomicrobiales bacterium]|nr:ADP-ribosylglycohydrolase family protein [Verrucomicrobiales bacterium]
MRWMTILGLTWIAAFRGGAADRVLTREALVEKISGFWIGQLAGNYLGFPFETVYVEEPIPVIVDHYYTPFDAGNLRLNAKDSRGYVPFLFTEFDGAFSDDDTDIEFVTLHAVERYGLDIDYAQIAEVWKKHINRRIWVANRTARNLMSKGMIPPETGKKANNANWYQIDPQLVNEIWSAFYPGLPAQAAKRADWGARITSDDWGVHPTVLYGVMFSEAFFETNPETLVRSALKFIPADSPFHEGVQDVLRWHAESPSDWKSTRQKVHAKYFRYVKGDYAAPVSVVSSLVNGLCGVLAVLYGEGDFMRSVGIGVSAGYDCDNQSATVGGLLGVMHGAAAVPRALTRDCVPEEKPWDKPFNDSYVNTSRDELPVHSRISDLVERTVVIAEKALVREGGRKIDIGGKPAYRWPAVP